MFFVRSKLTKMLKNLIRNLFAAKRELTRFRAVYPNHPFSWVLGFTRMREDVDILLGILSQLCTAGLQTLSHCLAEGGSGTVCNLSISHVSHVQILVKFSSGAKTRVNKHLA